MRLHNLQNPLVSLIYELNRVGAIRYGRERQQRKLYLERYGAHIIVMKCMDGRVSALPLALGIQGGCCDIFQKPGARFSLGEAYTAHSYDDTVRYGLSKHRTIIVIISNHHSVNHPHHGCRAFENDHTTSTAHILALADEIKWLNTICYPGADIHVLPVTQDTDTDAVTFFSEKGAQIHIANFPPEDDLEAHLCENFPDFAKSERAIKVLASFVRCNRAHTQMVREKGRTFLECCHGEIALALGRGFGEWLNPDRNRAVILFPGGRQLADEIETAGNILLGNMEENEDLYIHGAVAVACGAYKDESKKGYAILRAREHARTMEEVLDARVPGLPYTIVAGTMNFKRQLFEPIEY